MHFIVALTKRRQVMDYQEFLDYVKENILDYLKQSRITADTSNEVIFDEKEYEVLSQKIMKILPETSCVQDRLQLIITAISAKHTMPY